MNCCAPNCEKPSTQSTGAGSLCHHHYMLWRLHGYVGTRYPPTCTVDGCSNRHQAQGFCSKHYKRFREYGSTEDRPRKNARATCSVDDCYGKSFARGMCSRHYWRVKKYGTTDLPPPDVPDPKLCAQCGGERPSHRSAYCSDICATRGAARIAQAKSRATHLRLSYGLTPDSYAALLEAQGGACAICGSTNPQNYRGRNEAFCVDHDHATKRVRGLLCTPCNSGLGLFKDNTDSLRSAIEYLNRAAMT